MNNNKLNQEMNNEELIQDTILVSDDNGMGANKITYGIDGKYYQFDSPSRYQILDKPTSDSLIIDGVIVTFSEGKLAVENGHQTKDDDFHDMLLKKALFDVYKKTGKTKFDVITNYSLDSHKQDKGVSISERINKIKTIKVKELYQEEVELTINRIDCYPECISGGILVKLNLREEDVIFIDIGTRNMQLIRMAKGVPNYETCIATKKGMSSVYRGIADVTKILNIGLNDEIAVQMYLEQTAEGKLANIDVADNEILEYLMKNNFDEMDKCFDEMGAGSLFTKYVFLGGGSRLLARFLDLKFKERTGKEPIYVENSYFATSLGLFRKGEQLYNYTKHKDGGKVSTKKTDKDKKKRSSKKATEGTGVKEAK